MQHPRLSASLAVAVTAAAAVVTGGTAHAAPPVKIPPPGEYVVQIPETPCGAFSLDVVDGSTARIFTKTDRTQLLHAAGPITGTLTSLVTGRSTTLSFSGPVWVNSERTVLTGPSLLFDAHRLELLRGRAVVPNDPTLDWQIVGRSTPLCPLLNP